MLLDVMMKDRFVCQLNYKKRGFPVMIDGKVTETYEIQDLMDFVETERPSLKGKNYSILPSKSRTFIKN